MEPLKSWQERLKELGIYDGPLDGISGPKTISAIKAFQKLHPPLAVDGVMGNKTLAYLYPTGLKRESQSIEISKKYGIPGENLVRCQLAYPMVLAWDMDKKINSFMCHKMVKDQLEAIFEETLEEYGIESIRDQCLDVFGGCYNYRKMRGGDSLSLHSWGIAVDIDPARNQLKWGSDKARMAQPYYNEWWNIVEKHGGVSLGRKYNYDWMHFQFE